MKELTSWQALSTHKGEIVCFGAGMVLLHTEELLAGQGILGKVNYIIDNDPKKQGTKLLYGGKPRRILSIHEIGNMKDLKNPLILITCEKDREVMAQLDGYALDDRWMVASYPKLNHIYKQNVEPALPETNGSAARIPRIIHSIWFGGKEIPGEQQRFIDGWSRLCPDYDLILWNEENYDVGQCDYMREAYEAGDYARASDYARMDILYRQGGFYMDTDVELLKNLNLLLGYSAVFTYGEWPVVNSGVICGAVPGCELVRYIRDVPRAEIHYRDEHGKPDSRTNCYYENRILREFGFKGDFTGQVHDGAAILPPAYFASKGSYFDCRDITERTIAVHHCAGSWKR